MKKSKNLKYDSSHIEVQGGLEGVRRNTSMYMGSTGVDGVWKAVGELLDNGVDEHLAGRNKAVMLHIDSDGSYWVLDQGTGIPQGIKEVHMHVNGKDIVNKLPTMQAVFGELHTSGKYRSDAYKNSIGTHGIGSKGTNATSEYFDVVTCFKGKWYSVGFKKGKITSVVQQMKKPGKGPDGKPLKGGTCIHFKPDPSIYSAKSFPPSMAAEWAEMTSYLNPGLGIVVSSAKGRKVYLSKKGAIDYVNARVTKLKAEVLTDKVFEFKSDTGDVVLAFTNAEGAEARGFTNGLHNKDGGMHVNSAVDALYDGLCQALIKAGKEKLVQGKAKKGDKTRPKVFRVADLKEGLVGLVNAKLHKAEFSSQDKAKLTDARMGKPFAELVTKAAAEFFKANPKVAVMLAERAGKLAALKNNFAMSKKQIGELNKLKKKGLSAKFLPPSEGRAHEREIFIVEGDSAGGPAKQARYDNQGILPIRGKIKNVIAAKGDKGLDSEEILNILAAIGYDPKAPDPYAKLACGKIIWLADPDPDGHHINCLGLGLNYKYLKEAFDRGMIYVAKTPEYYAIYKGKMYTADGARALRVKMDKAKVPASVQPIHIKGWGEINPSVMRVLAMNPDTRTLIQIEPLRESDVEFHNLMSESPESRRKLAGFAE
jgi:DNA gyrase/topoisomerase IV subunit B